jgi:hypothetical protein
MGKNVSEGIGLWINIACFLFITGDGEQDTPNKREKIILYLLTTVIIILPGD